MSLSQADKDLIEFAANAIKANYDNVNWWHMLMYIYICFYFYTIKIL